MRLRKGESLKVTIKNCKASLILYYQFRAKSSTDPAVRKIVSENRERALAKQRDYDRNMRTRVKDGIGTENENRIIAKKKVLCQQYYHNVRKHKKQAERQELFKRLGKGASTSANQ